MGLFFNRAKKSGYNAKNRLKLVLYSERQGLPPETMEKIKNEIIGVISKYVDVDVENLDIKITPNGMISGNSGPSLQANIPIIEKKVRR